MAEKTRQHTAHHSLDSFSDFEDHELRSTMRDFLEEEEKEKASIWNMATIAGIAMFFVSMIYIVQSVMGINSGLGDSLPVLPIIGAFLITFVGFGFFVGDRKRVKKARKKQKERRKDYFDKEFPADKFDAEEDVNLEKELFGTSSSTQTSKASKLHSSFDNYALRQSKKLYKSRTDKKWAGVCGGLAKYFGISSTVIRVLFVITFFASSGSTLLVYIALSLALSKEPPELMDDFNF